MLQYCCFIERWTGKTSEQGDDNRERNGEEMTGRVKETERVTKNKKIDIISTIIFITVYMLAVNVKPYQKPAAASCVIKPFCNVFHPLNGSPIIYTCTEQALRRWLAFAGG